MAITKDMIMTLRERTGAGMMDCKNALVEADGDMELAIELLRKKGAAAAEKKAGRIAAEGMIASARDEHASALAEVNCETDFVVNDESFRQFSQMVAVAVLNHRPANVAALADVVDEAGVSIEQARQDLISRIGENISVRRFERYEAEAGEQVSCYLHGTRIGVLVRMRGGDDGLGKDIAMHVAASRPVCISNEDMDPGLLERERRIYVAQTEDSGKPARIVEKIVDGKLQKFLKTNTLLGQIFIKDSTGKQTVAALLAERNASVVQMVRFELGEGMEKRSDDFVAEVMAQASGQ